MVLGLSALLGFEGALGFQGCKNQGLRAEGCRVKTSQ